MTNEVNSHSTMMLIERVQRTSDETPPWKGMAFTLPVDSDKLSEHLLRAYPNCSTLRERKHMAAIDFLKAELSQMQSRYSTSAAVAENEYLATPEATSLYSDAVDNHNRRGSVSSAQSPISVAKDSESMERTLQQAEPISAPTTLASPDPFISKSAQQFIFSAVDGRSLQPKTKRRMTGEERLAYKKTRKRGACPTCRRQKGKCTHIIDDSVNSRSSNMDTKALKRRLSFDLSMDREQVKKILEPAFEPNVARTIPGISPSSQHVLPSTKIIHGFSDSSNENDIALGDSRWYHGVGEGVETEIPRSPPPSTPEDVTSPSNDSPISVHTSTASTISPHTAI